MELMPKNHKQIDIQTPFSTCGYVFLFLWNCLSKAGEVEIRKSMGLDPFPKGAPIKRLHFLYLKIESGWLSLYWVTKGTQTDWKLVHIAIGCCWLSRTQ